MEKEIEFIKKKLKEKCPRKKIMELFMVKFDCFESRFNDCWEEAHKVPEQPKEEQPRYVDKYNDKYLPKSNGLDLPKRIMMFVRDNCELHNAGQGIIAINCNELWDMPLDTFYDVFGVKKR